MDIGSSSPGSNLNRLMDSLGFQDRTGDIAGAALDYAVGNNPGLVRNLVDALAPISTSELDKTAQSGFTPAGFAEKPAANYKHHFERYNHTYQSREQIVKGSLLGPGFDKALGTAVEKEIMADPKVRADWEAKLNGRIVYDGKADGTITIARPIKQNVPSFPNNTNRVLGDLAGRTNNPKINDELLNRLASFLEQAQKNQAPSQSSQTKPAAAQDKSDLSAILNDPSLSFEEKLAQFLFAFIDKKQKEIEKLMGEMDNKGGSKNPTAAQETEGKKHHKKHGGLFGGIADKVLKGDGNLGTAVLGSVAGNAILGPVGGVAGAAIFGGEQGFSQYLSIGGGLAGTYYGGPAGGAAGAQIGGALGAIGGGLARGQAQKAFGVESVGGSTSAAATGTDSADKKDSEQVQMAKLQRAVEQMNQLFATVTSMLQGIDSTIKNGPIQALRG